MSRLSGRVKRLRNVTHTFVTGHDWRLLADYWRVPLDDANVKPEEFESECEEIKRMLSKINGDDREGYTATIKEFAENNRLAYYAFMYKNALELSRTEQSGSWFPNSAEDFLTRIREVRQKARLSKG